MGRQKWTDDLIGARIKAKREHRGWSQSEMAKFLADHGIESMHPTTIAKIEAGSRSIRVNEAVAIADLFEMTVDALLGRTGPDDSTLTFALVILRQHAHDAVQLLEQTQGIASDIEDQLESIAETFQPTGMQGLRQASDAIQSEVKSLRSHATKLESAATAMIARSKTGRRKQK